LSVWRPAVFAALVLATVAAFFVTQHLKVTTPLINGLPRPFPAAFNPISGRTCASEHPPHRLIDYRRVRFSFYLQRRSDDVGLYVISEQTGEIVATVAADRHMRLGVRNPDGVFSWNGRQDSANGYSNGAFAPDGTYYFRIALQHEGPTIDWTQDPFRIITTTPHPRVTAVVVTGSAAPSTGPAVISPPAGSVTIHFSPGAYRSAFIQIYRTDPPGTARLVKSFRVRGASGVAIWNGLIGGRPATAGTYLVGMAVTDQACNPARFPVVVPPPAGLTPHAGVTVHYLGATPPLTPVSASSTVDIPVQSATTGYHWTLSRFGRRKPVLGGSATGTLRLHVPALGAGLYELTLHSAGHSALAPVIASAVGRGGATRVLVVVPALGWQASNPVDDDGDGLPNTLLAGDRIALTRPLAGGSPAGLADEAALLTYLDHHHLPYQLTSEVALVTGMGPRLTGHSGVILDGDFTWTPPRLRPMLLAYVGNGGHLLSIGQGSLLRPTPLSATTAGPPGPAAAADPFGARPGRHVDATGALITVITDPLGIFKLTGGVLAGSRGYQVIAPPAGAVASLAGLTATMPGVTGFRLGRGTVVDVGLDGFQRSLAHNTSAQELLTRLWQILSG